MSGVQIYPSACIVDSDSILLYGQYYNVKVKCVEVRLNNELVPCSFELCKHRPDFCIKILGKKSTDFKNRSCRFIFDNYLSIDNINLKFPFEDISGIGPNIISTLCKNYNHRLDEWIKYNFNLGFDAIVIFNNEKNMKSALNENENKIEEMNVVTKNYKRVYVIDFPYEPFQGEHWNTIQRISLSIGCNAFRKICRYIALIDADEFIYIEKNKQIGDFLIRYNTTFSVQSNILTNKSNDDTIDNNILSICNYVGENKYTKVFLRTSEMSENEFVISPHDHLSKITLDKKDIIHYHCWVNERYSYQEGMAQIDLKKEMFNHQSNP